MPHNHAQDNPLKTGDIPETVIRRLPVYLRYLSEMAQKEIERISSRELAAKMGITASQLRQDLNWFGSFGQQGYGYRVADLLREVNRILGIDQPKEMVLVGAGQLGRAIINYPSFPGKGFMFKAVFDSDPKVIGSKIAGLEVAPVTKLVSFLIRKKPQIGVITTPANAAQEIATILVSGGVKALWNFAPVALKVPTDVIVEHVHISESLMTLSFRMQQQKSPQAEGGNHNGNYNGKK